MRTLFVCLLAVLSLSACRSVVLEHDFEQDPNLAGWSTEAGRDRQYLCRWSHSSEGHIVAEKGMWKSPRFAVEPGRFYRLRFRARGTTRGYWVADFFNAEGEKLQADHYSSVDRSPEWTDNEFYFQGEQEAETARVAFRTFDKEGEFAVDEVSVREASARAAARWADRLYAQLPSLKFRPPADRWKLIPRSIETLRKGRELDVVMLGDSIVNDTANSAYDALLERAWGAQFNLTTSVRGGTGCTFYEKKNRVQEYVVRHSPDLVIIGGISHKYNVEAIRSVIRQVRAGCDAEILVLSGAVNPPEQSRDFFVQFSGLPEDKAARLADTYRERLKQMTEEENVEYFDMREAWESYIERVDRPRKWFMRDDTHANARGKQILARILLTYFTPDA